MGPVQGRSNSIVQRTNAVDTAATRPAEPAKPDAGKPEEEVQANRSDGSAKRFDASIEGMVRSVIVGQSKVESVAAAPAGQTSPASMVDRMKNEGMTNVSDPPSDDQLREYYTKHAPAHDLIAGGEYSKAAEKYRELQSKDANLSSFSTYQKIEQQLQVASSMKNAGVKNVQFPPSEQNAKDYFKALGKSEPKLSNRALGNEFQRYVKAFYHHEGRDIVYRSKQKPDGKGGQYEAKAPESWSELNSERQMYPQATRKIDCEGYAYLAEKLLGQAGVTNAKFVVVGPPDDPSTKDVNESEKAHVMLAGVRDGEAIVVSNDRALTGPSSDRSKLLDIGYPKAVGGPREEDSEAWKATRKYENKVQ